MYDVKFSMKCHTYFSGKNNIGYESSIVLFSESISSVV